MKVIAGLYDANDNLVDTNSAAPISFKLSDETKDMGSLSSLEEQIKAGVAQVFLCRRQKQGIYKLLLLLPDLFPE